MSADPHPFIIAAQDLFARKGWPYKPIEGLLIGRFNHPLGVKLTLAVDAGKVAAIGRLDATVSERRISEALLRVNEFNRSFYAPQTYLVPSDDGLHPVCANSMSITLFNADHATAIVADFIGSIGAWVEWWAQHTNPLELHPIERWWTTGVRSPWADVLVDAGYLPEDAEGIDDIEAFASELLVEYCTTMGPSRDT